jgi:hypothetical protein
MLYGVTFQQVVALDVAPLKFINTLRARRIDPKAKIDTYFRLDGFIISFHLSIASIPTIDITASHGVTSLKRRGPNECPPHQHTNDEINNVYVIYTALDR